MEKPEKEEIKDLDNIKPIDHGTIAKPHTPVYKMHRYFARRPYSVFSELIKHYSNPGSIILDPFCGGGVTVVEGLRLKRKVVGVDINPMATFITRMEVLDVDLEELQKAFEEIEAKVKDEILELYMTKCPKCGKDTPADWFEWSKVYKCNSCEEIILVSSAKKLGFGRYECTNSKCKAVIRPLENKQLPDKMISVYSECKSCGNKLEHEPCEEDILLAKKIEKDFENTVHSKGLDIPDDKIPDGNMARENALFQRQIYHFFDLFTKRNLIANGILKKNLLSLGYSENVQNFLMLAFSASLRFTNNMVCRNTAWRGMKPLEWAKPAYWIPDVNLEANVLSYFISRKDSIFSGKKYTKKEIKYVPGEAKVFGELLSSKHFLLLTQSSENLPFPDNSVDDIITDPPYGGNVQYAELCDFWAIWLKETLMIDGVINNDSEAITTRHQGFPTAKTLSHYRQSLYNIFRECNRVLKPNRWMVLTFHNREFEVWNAIHLSAHDAGFFLAEEDGMIYQPAIKLYEHTINLRRGGSMLGDFILSFQKAEKPPEKKAIPYVEMEKRIQELAAETVLHHNGASLSMIYMKILPFLLNNNLLEQIGEKELPPYLKDSFEERNEKWYLKEKINDPLKDYLSKYSKSHYKEDYRVLDFIPVEARLEYLIRRFLYKNGSATQDEILNEIYTNLINSNAAEYGEINRVLNRIAKLVSGSKNKRKVWRLKEDIERQQKLDLIEEKIKEVVEVSEESEHDLVIRRLVELGAKEGYDSHIGRTEQKKYVDFKKLSLPMANNVQYGMDKRGFEIVTQIDVLWIKGDSIVAAFEVERSTTIDSGINRFRNLFAVQPNTTIGAYLVVPNSRKKETEKKLTSPANIKNGLSGTIGYILFDDLDVKKSVDIIDFSKIKRKVE